MNRLNEEDRQILVSRRRSPRHDRVRGPEASKRRSRRGVRGRTRLARPILCPVTATTTRLGQGQCGGLCCPTPDDNKVIKPDALAAEDLAGQVGLLVIRGTRHGSRTMVSQTVTRCRREADHLVALGTHQRDPRPLEKRSAAPRESGLTVVRGAHQEWSDPRRSVPRRHRRVGGRQSADGRCTGPVDVRINRAYSSTT